MRRPDAWCRALGDYAEQGGNKDAKKLVDDFFLASQDFDFTLFQAKRYSEPVGEKSEAALQKNLDALQRYPPLCCSCPSWLTRVSSWGSAHKVGI